MLFTVTNLIIAITCIASYLAFNNRQLFEQLMHNPYTEHRDKSYYRMVSSGFIHADMMHLIINMYVLYIFGDRIEQYFLAQFGDMIGRSLFLLIYLLAIVVGDIPSFIKHKNNPRYSAIGASGATSAIVFMYCILYPWNWLGLFFIIPIPAIIFAVLYLIYSSWASKNSRDNIGHDAHFWGAIAGVVFIFATNPQLIVYFIDILMQGPSSMPGMF